MTMLTHKETAKMIEKYRIPYAKSTLATAPENAGIKYPAVLKVVSDRIVHKSDAGAVITGIKNREELEAAFEKLDRKFRNKEGILIQEQVKGTELIIGSKYDQTFGQTIVFGLGGIYTEVLKDISIAIAPVEMKTALEMIKGIKAARILEGIRGQKPVNARRVAEIIVKTSKMAMKEKIKELDFNPVIANEKKAVVVDARVFI